MSPISIKVLQKYNKINQAALKNIESASEYREYTAREANLRAEIEIPRRRGRDVRQFLVSGALGGAHCGKIWRPESSGLYTHRHRSRYAPTESIFATLVASSRMGKLGELPRSRNWRRPMERSAVEFSRRRPGIGSGSRSWQSRARDCQSRPRPSAACRELPRSAAVFGRPHARNGSRRPRLRIRRWR